MTNIPIPNRMAGLSRYRGFVVPFFVAWLDRNGEEVDPRIRRDATPDFRIVSRSSYRRCVQMRACWLCGEQLGRHVSFVIGPMCAVNRVSSEPPSHRSCAEYAVRVCPHLTNPRAERREIGRPKRDAAGIMLTHNPGASAVWTTQRGWGPFKAEVGNDGLLYNIGEPELVTWWCEGRTATRAEVDAAVDKGLPHLMRMARSEGPESVRDIDAALATARRLIFPR